MQISRALGEVVASCNRMTMIRAEKEGYLVPIRRPGGRTVFYDRANFLRWMGIDPGVATIKRSPGRPRKHAA
jgi:hypothetical protein